MSTAKTTLLTQSERSKILPSLTKWTPNVEETSISRAIKFSSFSEAWGFMSRVALRAEKLNHHPEWKNVRFRRMLMTGVQSCRYNIDDALGEWIVEERRDIGGIHRLHFGAGRTSDRRELRLFLAVRHIDNNRRVRIRLRRKLNLALASITVY
jgi:4a-hydroxytetrahydrobiopterin dehydratase